MSILLVTTNELLNSSPEPTQESIVEDSMNFTITTTVESEPVAFISTAEPEGNVTPEVTSEPENAFISTAEPEGNVTPESEPVATSESEGNVTPESEPVATSEPEGNVTPESEQVVTSDPENLFSSSPESTAINEPISTESSSSSEPRSEITSEPDATSEPEIYISTSEPESEITTVSEPDSNPEPAISPTSESEIASTSEPESNPEPEILTTSEPEPEFISTSEPEPEAGPTTVPESEPALLSTSQPESNSEPETFSTSEPESIPESETLTTSEPDSNSEPENLATSEPESNTGLYSTSEPEIISTSEPESVPESETLTTSEPESNSEPENSATSEPESNSSLNSTSEPEGNVMSGTGVPESSSEPETHSPEPESLAEYFSTSEPEGAGQPEPSASQEPSSSPELLGNSTLSNAEPESLSEYFTPSFEPSQEPEVTPETGYAINGTVPESEGIAEFLNSTSEPISEAEAVAESEIWPEPGPDWSVALDEWQHAWPSHVYGFGLLFIIMTFLAIFFMIIVIYENKGVKRGKLTLSLLTMMTFFCSLRSISLLGDQYMSTKRFHFLASRLIWSFALPGLTSSFSLIFLVLLDTTKMSIGPPKFQKLSSIIAVTMTHLCIVGASDIIVLYQPAGKPMLVVCQGLFISYGAILAAGYLYVGLKIRENCKAGQVTDDQTSSIQRLTTLSFVSSAAATLVCLTHIYSAVSVFGVYSNKEYVDAWDWWALQSVMRIEELIPACIVLTLAARSIKGDYFSKISKFIHDHTPVCGFRKTKVKPIQIKVDEAATIMETGNATAIQGDMTTKSSVV